MRILISNDDGIYTRELSRSRKRPPKLAMCGSLPLTSSNLRWRRHHRK